MCDDKLRKQKLRVERNFDANGNMINEICTDPDDSYVWERVALFVGVVFGFLSLVTI